MMKTCVLAVLLAGCGRVDFVIAPATDGAIDGAPIADPVTIRGTTFRYTGFDNSRMVVGGVAVSARGATTTSLADGTYALTVPTGGVASPVVVRYEKTGQFTTDVQFELAGDVTGTNAALFAAGDGPVWNSGQMGDIYTSAGTARDAAAGLVNVGVRDRDGHALAAAVVTVTPAPGLMIYQANDGTPTATGETQTTYAHAIAMNAVAGDTTIEIAHAGYVFDPIHVTVTPGTFNYLVVAFPR